MVLNHVKDSFLLPYPYDYFHIPNRLSIYFKLCVNLLRCAQRTRFKLLVFFILFIFSNSFVKWWHCDWLKKQQLSTKYEKNK